VARIGFLLVLFYASLFAQHLFGQQKPADPPKPAQQPKEEVVEPPEEDESLKPRVYEFNPLEAQKDVRTGDYYFKKGNFKAAAKRFEEATKYDPGCADAYLRLGDAMERLHDKKGAKAAYQKYIELKPDSKGAGSLRKKVGG
jgi:tetratricopeptide (TPR) repeat protein